MFDAALPLWAEQGVDRAHGGFLEELPALGFAAANAFKRTRVLCRQVYVFSHAALLGWDRGAELSRDGADYFMQHAWLGETRGWARRLTPTGDVLDATPDLYDTAFALFALAWRYRLTREPHLRERALETLNFITTRMRLEKGFAHEVPPQGWRQQNPHMHLLEASLAAFDAMGDQRFLDLARELVGLFRTAFFDGHTLAEFFDDDWRRAPGDAGRIVEPGHQLEWAWILARYQALSGETLRAEAEALVRFAEAHGVDHASGAVCAQVRDDGVMLDANSRAWPNTERIKGHLALFELTGADPRAAVASSARLLLDRYLKVDPRGAWIDCFDGAGKQVAATIPASTFYHIFLAFAEVLRFEERLG